jgi:hypothetical protein
MRNWPKSGKTSPMELCKVNQMSIFERMFNGMTEWLDKKLDTLDEVDDDAMMARPKRKYLVRQITQSPQYRDSMIIDHYTPEQALEWYCWNWTPDNYIDQKFEVYELPDTPILTKEFTGEA